MEKKEKEIAEEYLSSLVDLNVNSKPLINMLTILAEENIEHGQVIVDAVEQHIAKIDPDVKLPVLYLIDSIVKNVGREYTTLFSHSIVNIFCGVFEKVNEKVRSKMFSLRQTWNDVFPSSKLYTLDVKVNCMDPGWPITATVAPVKIHLNPIFLKNKTEKEMQLQLREKHRELLELQKRKIELELVATKKHIEEQEKQLSMQAASVKTQSTTSTATTVTVTSTKTTTPNETAVRPDSTLSSRVQSTSFSGSNQTQPSSMLNTVQSRTRIAPVNPALISSIRLRDPRLMRQMQSQMVAQNHPQQQHNNARHFNGPRGRQLPPHQLAAATGRFSPTMNRQQFQHSNFQHNMPSTNIPSNNNMMNNDLFDGKRTSANNNNNAMNKDDVNKFEKNKNQQQKNVSKSSSISKTKSTSIKSSIASSSGTSSRSNSKSTSDRMTSSSSTNKLNTSASPSSSSNNGANNVSPKLSSKDGSSSSSKTRKESSGSKSSPSRSSSTSNKSSGEKKRSSDSMLSSPTSSLTAKLDKIPLKSDSKILKSKSSSSSPSKLFKDLKIPSKNRNYMRRNRESSKSPTITNNSKDDHQQSTCISPIPPEPPRITDTELDNKSLSSDVVKTTVIVTESTSSIADTKLPPVISTNTTAVIEKSTIPSTSSTTSTTKVDNNKEDNIESTLTSLMDTKHKLDIAAVDSIAKIEPTKDVDFRLIPTNTITTPSGLSSISSIGLSSIDKSAATANKRVSEERILDEPLAKKTKSDEIELFGSKDVDLRMELTQNMIHAPTPPPPPMISTATTTKTDEKLGWAVIKADIPKVSSTSLDAVRAKLAEATRAKELQLQQQKQHIANTKDTDYRLQLKHSAGIIDGGIDENSQEGNEAQFKMIVSQAQEQLDNDNINLEQYNTLMKQVVSIRAKQKRDSMKRKSERIVVNNTTPISEEDCGFTSSGNESDSKKHSSGNEHRKSNDGSDVKTKRQRKSKWSAPSPWENQQQMQQGHFQQQQQFGGYQQHGSFVGPSNNGVQNPWHQSMPFTTNMSSMQSTQLLTTTNGLSGNTNPAFIGHNQQQQSSIKSERTISIDGIPREIRFYDEIAIAFMSEGGREPKEIGFQSGDRRVIIDNRESIVLSFNDAYKPFMINGQSYLIRFGSPIRELYINNQYYECFFGDPPTNVMLNGRVHTFKIDGPSPQVRIGSLRTDLVVGKVDLYIDASMKVPLFLDAHVQTFELANQMHTVQFADYLLTALIDGQPFMVEYGGMPKRFRIGDRDRFIRFSVLPDGLMAGLVYIKNMKRTDHHKGIQSPQPVVIADIAPPSPILPIVPSAEAIVVPSSITAPPTVSLPAIDQSIVTTTENIENIPSTPLTTQSTIVSAVDKPIASPAPPPPPVIVPALNISDLLQKLLESGILSNKPVADNKDKQKEKEKFKPILLNKPEHWKQRQPALIHALFSGMQCSSCGVRFPPEQTIKYSQHLDWHFRQNRRDRDSARRAHSRRWYYDVADWIQYEEIEDLDEREKNWFETQQLAMSPSNNDDGQRNESPVPSCIAGPEDVDKSCDMCHDQFETFFNEETEEWHLRNAVRMDEKTYHPICYQDYKTSLTMDESAIAVDTSTVEEAKIEDVKIILDDDDDVIVVPAEEPSITEIPDDEDEEPIVTIDDKDKDVIIDDDTSSKDVVIQEDDTTSQTKVEEKSADNENAAAGGETSTAAENEVVEKAPTVTVTKTNTLDVNELNATYEPIGNESDIQILVPQISVLDLDDFEEKPDSGVMLDESSQASIKIKQEPKDDGYDFEEDDGFEEVGTFESDVIVDSPVIAADDYQSTTQSTSVSQSGSGTLITSMDGNVELQDAQPTSLGTNRIKINITKNVTKTNVNSETNTNKTISTTDTLAADISQPEEEIVFTYKNSMKTIPFKKMATVKSGQETSGLCSIM